MSGAAHPAAVCLHSQGIFFHLPKGVFTSFKFLKHFLNVYHFNSCVFFLSLLMHNLSLMCMFLPINIFRPAAFCTGFTKLISFDYLCLEFLFALWVPEYTS